MPDTLSASDLGHRFVEAVAQKDAEGLRAVLADDVDFRGMTPRRFWEAGDPDGVIAIVFGTWFEPSDEFDGPPLVESGAVADTQRVGYRFDGHDADGPFVVEQQAYLRERDGRIAWMRVLCSGRRVPG